VKFITEEVSYCYPVVASHVELIGGLATVGKRSRMINLSDEGQVCARVLH
jgi:hypothetical protein